MHGELQLGIRVRYDLRCPGVGADQHDLAVHEIARGGEADAGRAGGEFGVVREPKRAPTGMHEHDVAGTDRRGALPRQRALEIR
ncbi:hypothetical protein D3C83_50560 [compost metagenome]